MTSRWKAKKRPTAEEQRAAKQAEALTSCGKGHHRLTATFRPGERLCTVCGIVRYCADCLRENRLKAPQGGHAYALDCVKHQKVEAGLP